MKEVSKKEGIISEERIVDAANALFCIEKGFLSPESVNGKGQIATLTLQAAGRDAVRAVCGLALECLDAQFWASDKEIEAARKLVAGYAEGGCIPDTAFWIQDTALKPSGLEILVQYLASDLHGSFPGLNRGAKSRLFSYASDIFLQEPSAPDESIPVAFDKLNSNGANQSLKFTQGFIRGN